MLAVASVLTGFNNGAVEIGMQAVIAEYAPPGERAAAMAGWSAANGVRGIIAPFVSTLLYAAGIVDVAEGHRALRAGVHGRRDPVCVRGSGARVPVTRSRRPPSNGLDLAYERTVDHP